MELHSTNLIDVPGFSGPYTDDAAPDGEDGGEEGGGDDGSGARRTILLALLGIVGFGIPLLITDSKTLFWALALSLGVFMGPAQAASRSLMARIAPAE